MKQILWIDACARQNSRTRLLAQKVLEKLDGRVTERNLYREQLFPLEWEQVERRGRCVAAGDLSAPLLQYATEFAAADEIVVAAPYWDLSFPAILKVYFEHVTITGVTFRYSPEGIPIGLCRAKRLFYITTAGGPIAGRNLGFDYVKALAAAFYGIPQVRCFQAENLDIQGADAAGILQQAIGALPEKL